MHGLGPERRIENRIKRAVESIGGLAVKQAGTAGMPDRLIILPGGRHLWLELKAKGGRLSKLQELAIARLRAMGCEVDVVTGPVEAEDYIARLEGIAADVKS